MTQAQCLQKLLPLFSRYYDVSQDVAAPFCAQAVFHSTDEQYFLVKSARISSSVSSEYVYFALADTLSPSVLQDLAQKAWDAALVNVKPFWGHKSSDVSLIVICDAIEDAAASVARKISFYKSYKFSFYGWSSFSLVLFDVSSLRATYNRRGRRLAKLFSSIVKTSA